MGLGRVEFIQAFDGLNMHGRAHDWFGYWDRSMRIRDLTAISYMIRLERECANVTVLCCDAVR